MVVSQCKGTIPEVNKYIDIGREMVYNRGISRTVSDEGKGKE